MKSSFIEKAIMYVKYQGLILCSYVKSSLDWRRSTAWTRQELFQVGDNESGAYLVARFGAAYAPGVVAVQFTERHHQ